MGIGGRRKNFFYGKKAFSPPPKPRSTFSKKRSTAAPVGRTRLPHHSAVRRTDLSRVTCHAALCLKNKSFLRCPSYRLSRVTCHTALHLKNKMFSPLSVVRAVTCHVSHSFAPEKQNVFCCAILRCPSYGLSRVTCHAELHFFYKIRAYRNNLCMWC